MLYVKMLKSILMLIKYERAARFNCGVSYLLGAALKRLNITVKKKTLSHPKADTKLRDKFILQVNELEKNHPIIYLDESGFKSHDYRPHGYSRKGVPCLWQYNWQLKNQTECHWSNP